VRWRYLQASKEDKGKILDEFTKVTGYHIRTFADWQEDKPGFLEADLVLHCGESTEGFYLNTLSAADVATGWSECVGVWGKDHIK
jgi:hypothetical protein